MQLFEGGHRGVIKDLEGEKGKGINGELGAQRSDLVVHYLAVYSI